MRFAVGDIHGCLDELKRTLDLAGFSDSDRLYGVGDLCDRGTQNLETLEFLMGMKNFFTVFGDHDIWIYQYLDVSRRPREDYGLVRDVWLANGGGSTLGQLPLPGMGDDIASWLGSLPLTIDLEDAIIMHVPSPYVMERFSSVRNLRMEDLLGLHCMHDYDTFFWGRGILDFIGGDRMNCPFPAESFLASAEKRLVICGHNPVFSTPLYSPAYNILDIDTGAFAVPARGYDYNGRLTVFNIDERRWHQNDGSEGALP